MLWCLLNITACVSKNWSVLQDVISHQVMLFGVLELCDVAWIRYLLIFATYKT